MSGVTDGDARIGPSGQYEGGDLRGVTDELDYLADLGVTAIWLSAPYENRNLAGAAIDPGADPHTYSAYHGYWPSPANVVFSGGSATPRPAVESRIGTEADLRALVDTAHATTGVDGHGMKVLFDPNQRWENAGNARRIIRELEAVGNVLLLEDPLPRWMLLDFAELRRFSSIPIVLHVSLPYVYQGQRPHDAINAIAHHAVDGFNFNGGLAKFQALDHIAATAGLYCWHGSEVDLRAQVEPLFIKYGVDVVFAGHEHFYERIKPQNGIYYFTQGGSAKLREGNIRVNSALTAKGYDTDNVFMVAELGKDSMQFQVVSRAGRRVDSGSLPLMPEPKSADDKSSSK